MGGPLEKSAENKLKKHEKDEEGKKKNKDPFDEILCDLDEYQEGCEPRNLSDSGE